MPAQAGTQVTVPGSRDHSGSAPAATVPSQQTAHRLRDELDSRLRGNDVRMRRGCAPVPRRL